MYESVEEAKAATAAAIAHDAVDAAVADPNVGAGEDQNPTDFSDSDVQDADVDACEPEQGECPRESPPTSDLCFFEISPRKRRRLRNHEFGERRVLHRQGFFFYGRSDATYEEAELTREGDLAWYPLV